VSSPNAFLVTLFALMCVTACAAESAPAQTDHWLADGSDQAVAEVIDAVTTFPTQLDPRIWDGMKMKPDVRETTLRIVDRIIAGTGIEGLTVDGVDLTEAMPPMNTTTHRISGCTSSSIPTRSHPARCEMC
jgi:hypothetical protein